MPLSQEEIDLIQALSGDVDKADKGRLVNRLRELHVPRLDGVDAGAVRHTFLIKKSEQESSMATLGDKITKDEDVAKMEMSGEAKAAALKILGDAAEKLNTLIGMVKQAAEGGEGGAYPEDMTKMCGDVMKGLGELGGAEKSEKAEGDEEPPELTVEEIEAEKAKKAAMTDEEKAEAEKAEAEKAEAEKAEKGLTLSPEGTIDLGAGMVLDGPVAKMADEYIAKAGRSMSKKNLAELRKAMGGMLTLWKSVDPDQGDQMKAFMANVTKAMGQQDAATEKIVKAMGALATKVEASAGAPGPNKVGGGNSVNDDGEPIKKSAPEPIVYGQDMNDRRLVPGSDEGHYF